MEYSEAGRAVELEVEKAAGVLEVIEETEAVVGGEAVETGAEVGALDTLETGVVVGALEVDEIGALAVPVVSSGGMTTRRGALEKTGAVLPMVGRDGRPLAAGAAVGTASACSALASAMI